MREASAGQAILFRVYSQLCLLPLENVMETMRPLPVEPIVGAPSFVLGLAIIRGAALPVIDMAGLLAQRSAEPSRFLTVRTGSRQFALAVTDVLGVRRIAAQQFKELPPVLQAGAEAIAAVASRDGELLLLLEATRLVSEQAFTTFNESDA